MEHCLTDGQARHGWGGWENGDLCHARARHLAPLPWGGPEWGGACVLLELEALVDGQLAVTCERIVSER